MSNQLLTDTLSTMALSNSEKGKMSLDFAITLQLRKSTRFALVHCNYCCDAWSREDSMGTLGIRRLGLPASVVRTVKVSGSTLSKVIKVNLGASLGGKKATIQLRKVGTTVYRSPSVVMLNKLGTAQLTRLIPFGSAIRVLVGGRSLAATIVR